MISQYKPVYEKEERDALKLIADSDSWFSEFKETEAFEKELCEKSGAKYCSVVSNGTIAISLALLAKRIKAGQNVLVPSITMIATANAVRLIGANPIFGDIELSSNCLDPNSLAMNQVVYDKQISAVIYVTLNGRMNTQAVQALMKLCNERGIAFIKDDAQSLGSKSDEGLSLQDEKYGDIHTISFSPHKIISCGQGGAILTNSRELFENCERLKDFGRISGGSDIHDYFGINSKFTDIQATFGLAQVKKIESKIAAKKDIYDVYLNALDKIPQIKMFKRGEHHTPWFVDIYSIDRDKIGEHLLKNDIQTRKMYPANHKQLCYNTDDNLPISDAIANTGLWLPSSFDLTKKDILHICSKIKELYKK